MMEDEHRRISDDFDWTQNNVATSSSGAGLSSGHSGRYCLINSDNEIINNYLMRLSMRAIIIKTKLRP